MAAIVSCGMHWLRAFSPWEISRQVFGPGERASASSSRLLATSKIATKLQTAAWPRPAIWSMSQANASEIQAKRRLSPAQVPLCRGAEPRRFSDPPRRPGRRPAATAPAPLGGRSGTAGRPHPTRRVAGPKGSPKQCRCAHSCCAPAREGTFLRAAASHSGKGTSPPQARKVSMTPPSDPVLEMTELPYEPRRRRRLPAPLHRVSAVEELAEFWLFRRSVGAWVAARCLGMLFLALPAWFAVAYLLVHFNVPHRLSLLALALSLPGFGLPAFYLTHC